MPATLSPGLPDSPYAAELRRGGGIRPFYPVVEAEYVLGQLRQSRTLIRIACTFAFLILILRGVDLTLAKAWRPVLMADFLVILTGSVVLTVLAWTNLFERHYVRWASILLPLRNVIIAGHLAEAAARGQSEMLMMLPLMMIGPFFFLGLRFRMALLCGGATLVAFIATSLVFDLALPIAGRAIVLMAVSLAACAIAARHLEVWSRNAFLESRNVEELSQRDGLTGTKNRRVFDEHLQRLWMQGITDRRTLAILLIDVDHFKDYNDRYGHQAGDQALRQVVQTAHEFVRRPSDILARYGGEEFAAVLYDIDPKDAKQIAERMRRAIELLGIQHAGSRTATRLTVSIGVAIIEPTRARDWRGGLQLADQALYQAKVRGRNRIEIMNEAEYQQLVTGVFSREQPV